MVRSGLSLRLSYAFFCYSFWNEIVPYHVYHNEFSSTFVKLYMRLSITHHNKTKNVFNYLSQDSYLVLMEH